MIENLDLCCAELGQQLATADAKNEKLLTDALGVLEEHGVYAFFLYLRCKENNHKIFDASYHFLKKTPHDQPLLTQANTDELKDIQALGKNLDQLLFAYDLLRRSLVYARYHAKANQMNEQDCR